MLTVNLELLNSLQPENVVFSTVSEDVTLPSWLTDGLPMN